MRWQKRAVVLLCTALAFGVAPAETPSAGMSAPVGTKQVQIMDPVFNMVAYTMTIPANWNFQGAVLTGPGCDGDRTAYAYRVWSDDFRYGVQRTPEVEWNTPSNSGMPSSPKCKTAPTMTATDYGNRVAPVIRPGSRILSVDTAPQAAVLAQNSQQLETMMASSAVQMGMPRPRFTSDAKQLRIEYMMGSQPEEEFLQVMMQVGETATITAMNRPGAALRTGYAMTAKTTAWVVGERAPKGQLDAWGARLEAIRTSVKVNPDWDNRVVQWMKDRGAQRTRQSWQMTTSVLKQGQQQHDALMANGQAFNQQQQAAADSRNRQFQQNMANKDQQNQAFQARMDARSAHNADLTDYLLDQQYYVNPADGSRSTISTTYTNNWQNQAGEQVQTNLQGYDPNGQVQGNWTQLQPIHH